MLNLQNLELLHRHSDGGYSPMAEHTVEDHDPERELLRGQLRGARIFRCTECADEVDVVPPCSAQGDDASG